MPLYEYQCDSCSHEWDEFHGMKDRVERCPSCRKKKAKRLISLPLGIRTDSTFMAGYGTLRDQVQGEESLRAVVEGAKRQGYTPNASDVYMPGVADSIGDPKAFFRADAVSDIRKRADARGNGLQGRVEVKARPQDRPAKRVALNSRIVEEMRREEIRKNPELARKDQRELRAEIISKHGSKE